MNDRGVTSSVRASREEVSSTAQVQAFQRDGYLAIAPIMTPEEVKRTRAALERLFAARAGVDRGDFLDLVGTDESPGQAALPQILMPVRYAPELAELTIRPRLLALAAQLLGEGVAPEGEHAILKPGGSGPATPLHQDEAFWGEATAYESISIWIPLQDVGPSNGCLHFVPGSHKLGVLPHHSLRGDPHNNGIEVDGAKTFTPTPQRLQAGAATIHHCRTLHGAGPNASGAPRFAYVFGFGLPPRPAEQPRSFPWLREKVLWREERARRRGLELTKMRREL